MTHKKQERILHLITMALDFILLWMGLFLAQMLWKSGQHNAEGEIRVWIYAPLFILVYVGILNLTGTYRVTWKYADVRDMLRLLVGCVLSSGICLLLNRIFSLDYPRLVIGFHGVFSFVLLVASRYAWLLVQNLLFAEKNEKHVRRALIIGAGPEGIALVKALRTLEDGARHEAVAYLDDDVDKLYRRVSGVPVEGNTADIDKVISSRHVDEVLFTSPIEKSEVTNYLYTHALMSGCEVSRFELGTLKPLLMADVLDGARWDDKDLSMTYKHNIAIIGAGELARELAALCSENGAGKVFCLDSDPIRLGEMARAGAWVKLGSPSGEKTLRDFLRFARPSYVFYLAGVGEQGIIEGNEQAVIRLNVLSPLNALRCSASCAESFVYVTDIRDEDGSSRLFTAGEAAVLRPTDDAIAVSAVSISGLLDENGPLARMVARAGSGKPLSAVAGSRKAFISCRSAAAALIAMARNRFSGSFLLRGGVSTDLTELAGTVLKVSGSRAELLTEEPSRTDRDPDILLQTTSLDYVFRKEEADIELPPEIITVPPVCPSEEVCAELLKG